MKDVKMIKKSFARYLNETKEDFSEEQLKNLDFFYGLFPVSEDQLSLDLGAAADELRELGLIDYNLDDSGPGPPQWIIVVTSLGKKISRQRNTELGALRDEQEWSRYDIPRGDSKLSNAIGAEFERIRDRRDTRFNRQTKTNVPMNSYGGIKRVALDKICRAYRQVPDMEKLLDLFAAGRARFGGEILTVDGKQIWPRMLAKYVGVVWRPADKFRVR